MRIAAPRRLHRRQRRTPTPAQLRDPVRRMQGSAPRRSSGPRAGTAAAPTDARRPRSFPYTDMGRARLDHLEHAARHACAPTASPATSSSAAPGAAAAAIFMRGYLDGPRDRRSRGLGRRPLPASRPTATDGPARPRRRPQPGPRRLRPLRAPRRAGALPPGRVPPTRSADAPIERIALLRIGRARRRRRRRARRASTAGGRSGGFVIVDDYGRPERPAGRRRVPRRATASTTRSSASTGTAVAWRKPTERAGSRACAPTAAAASPGPRPRSRRRTPAGGASTSRVVVVFYNMRREAARTLHSLSRAYQRGIDDLDYEVHRGRERLRARPEARAEEFVRSFGPEFRYVDLGDEATPSPVAALNRGHRDRAGRRRSRS